MKEPFDPLKSGWVTCPECDGKCWNIIKRHGWPHIITCHRCEGMGIVVTPYYGWLPIRRYLNEKQSTWGESRALILASIHWNP